MSHLLVIYLDIMRQKFLMRRIFKKQKEKRLNYLKTFYRFLKDIFKSKRLLIDLAKNDFKSRYMGNYLGILWAFVQPTAMIIIFWFVFQVGFKSMPVDNFPFILWLMAGMIPWFFFAESLQRRNGELYLCQSVRILPDSAMPHGLFYSLQMDCIYSKF